jgi:hypothetical protein
MPMLEDVASEVARQPERLERYAKVTLPKAPDGSIFSGAGDSYAAAIAGFYASRGHCIALDPYTLASEPSVSEGVEVFFISVSGRTSSNLKAAAAVKRYARKTTVVTASEASPLTKGADEVVRLPMEYLPRTPGMLSFTLSALAVLKMAGANGAWDFRGAFRRAKVDSRRLLLGSATTYLLGNSLAHAAALYGAAKVYEILGARAHAEVLEEFSHLELFSATPSDSVDVFSSFDPAGMAAKLSRALAKEGYCSGILPSWGTSPGEKFFHTVFATQLWCLEEARRAGLDRPRFLTGAKRLRVSDSMI